MPDGGTSCVDGGPAPSQPDCNVIKPIRLPLLSRMSAEARKKFGSADCVIDNSGRPSSPPPILPRRARRSLPCRAASVNDYAAELQLQQNRVLIRRQSQPEYVGVARYVSLSLSQVVHPLGFLSFILLLLLLQTTYFRVHWIAGRVLVRRGDRLSIATGFGGGTVGDRFLQRVVSMFIGWPQPKFGRQRSS